MNNLKSILYTILVVVILVSIVKFFIKLLPIFILILLLSYIIFKAKIFFKSKKINNSYNQNTYNKSSIDDNNEKIIDVDYKEVD